jgi:hypothetical protein
VKALFTVLVVVVILYGVYSGAMAIWSYFELSNLVEEVVPRELTKTGDRGWGSVDRMQAIRSAIIKGARNDGIVLDPAAVSVTEEEGALWVRINAPYPLVRLRGERIVDIPVSTAHSFALKPDSR